MDALNIVEDLLHLSPLEILEMLMILYKSQGCKVNPLRIPGRYHLYIAITTKDNEKSLAECRIGLQVVDKEAVRSFFSLMKSENATQGAIITIGEVSDQARREVKKKPIYLYDGNEFLSLWKNINIPYPIAAGTQLTEGSDYQKLPSVGNEVVYGEVSVPNQGALISPDQEDTSTEIAEFSPAEKQAPSFVQPESEFQKDLSPGHTRDAIHRLLGGEPLINSPAGTVEPLAEETVINQTIPDGSELSEKDAEAGELFTNEKQASLIDQPETESETELESTHIHTGVDFLAGFEELKDAPPENEAETQLETAVLDQIVSTTPEQMGLPEGGGIPSAEKQTQPIDQPESESETGLESTAIQTGTDFSTSNEELKNAPPELEEAPQPETAVLVQIVSTMLEQMNLPEGGETPSGEKQALLIDQPELESETGLASAAIQANVDFLTGNEELKNAPPENEAGTQPETATLDQIASTLPDQMVLHEEGGIPLVEKQAPQIDQPESESETGLASAAIQTGTDISTRNEELINALPEIEEAPQPETAVLDQIASTLPEEMGLPEGGGIPSTEKQAPPFLRLESEFQMNSEPGDTENVIHRLFGREPLISSPSETAEPLAEETVIHQTIPNVAEQAGKEPETGELITNEKQAPLIDQPERESEVESEPINSQTDVNSSREGEGLEGLSSLTKEKIHTEVHNFEESVTSGQDQTSNLEPYRNGYNPEDELIPSLDQSVPGLKTELVPDSTPVSPNLEEVSRQNLSDIQVNTAPISSNETDKLSPSHEIDAKDEISESPEAVEKIPALEQDGSSEKPVEPSQHTQDIESSDDFQEPKIVVFNPAQPTTSYTRGPDPDNPSLSMAYDALEGDSPCIFITGRTGTGKNILLDYFTNTTSKNVIALAPNGLGALNSEGQIIQSFFDFPYGIINENDVHEIPDPAQRELYRHIDTIIVDEISMVNANLVDAMDLFMRLNGRESDKPFGGTQVILFGDLFQPAPDMTKNEISDLLTKNYRSRFFFDAHVFQRLPIELIELQKDYYHRDETLAALLNSIRMNSLDDAQIKLLTGRYNPNFITPIEKSYVTLTSNDSIAAQINQDHLRQLPLPECIHIAEIEGDFEEQAYPADKELILRRGAQVMLLRDDRVKRWERGTIGKVTSMSECTVQVEIDQDGSPFIFRIERENWQNYHYKLDALTGKIEKELLGEFTQYPLSLAWAVSVHKSQGYRLDNAVIDLNNDEDEHGQIYAALSSCKSLDGIVLKDEIWRTDIPYADNRILEIARRYFQYS